MLDRNTELNKIMSMYSYNYGECGEKPFEMSVGVTHDDLPNSDINIALNGRHVIRAHLNGLRDLKYHLEHLDTSCFYFPGRLEQDRNDDQPTRDESFYYPEHETALIVFEVCGFKGSEQDIWSNLEAVDPSLTEVGYLAAPVIVKGKKGWRFHVLVEKGGHISRYEPLFSMRSWAQGLSGVRRAGTEGYAICEYVNAEAMNPGYAMSVDQITGPMRIWGRGDVLGALAYPCLTSRENEELVNNCAKAVTKCPLSYGGASVDELARVIWRAVTHASRASVYCNK